jgi:glycosyltransferase involved in cell wall biosynthesis
VVSLMSRPVVFLAWSSVAGRSREIAAALGGESRCYYDLRITRRAFVPVRYLLSALRTVGYVVARRPRAMIVTNPPVFASMVIYPYVALTGAPLLLDSHPDAFRDDSAHARFLRIHAWLARRATATLVTTDDLVARVEAWGGTGLVVHEPEPEWAIDSDAPLPARPRILVLGSLSRDEPVAEVLAAAAELVDVDFEFTGDVRRCDPHVVESAPTNVTFLGFLDRDAYVAALERASVAVVLTSWLDWAVPRSAYDAVYARRPLVLTASPVLNELFPYAIAVDNDHGSIATGIAEAVARHGELVAATSAAFALQSDRWAGQLERLRSLAGVNTAVGRAAQPS